MLSEEDIKNVYRMVVQRLTSTEKSCFEDVEDAIQNAWEKYLRHNMHIEDRDKLIAWFLVVVRHSMVDSYRYQKRQQELRESLISMCSEPSEDFGVKIGIIDSLIDIEMKSKMLSEEEQKLLAMFLKEPDLKKIAAKQNESYETVKKRFQRMCQRLRALPASKKPGKRPTNC